MRVLGVKPLIAFGILASLFVPLSVMASDDAPCVKNYKVKGSFFTGKTYSTWQDFPGVPKASAFTRAYVFIVKEGWKIEQSDKDVGVISASKPVGSQSENLNILIEDLDQGCKVTATHLIPGGAAASKAELQNLFCDLMVEVGKQNDTK